MRHSFSTRGAAASMLSVLILGSLAIPRDASAYEVKPVSDGGSISGAITFGDDYPPLQNLKVDRDVATCGIKQVSEEFVVDPESKGLKGVVFTLEGVEAGKAFPATALQLSQQGCRYEPHVQIGFIDPADATAASASASSDGIQMTILNEDDVFHNVHGFDDDRGTVFNVPSLPATTIERHFDHAGVYEIKCDVHSWMSSWVFISDTPYVAMSDESGEFHIEGVPAGSYTLHIWHEGLGSLDREVEVTAGQDTRVDFPLGKSGG